MRIQLLSRFALAALLAGSRATSACAQGTARSLDLDTSIRAAGMGGASAAVWWGEPGVWGNPASLSGVEGVGWVDGRTRLVPQLDPNVKFRSSRLLLGGAGVGVSLMGDPIGGLGRVRLDYGASPGTDPFGNPTAPFNSFEKTEAWAVGVSPLRLFDALRGTRGKGAREPGPVDFAAGFQHKHTLVALAPSTGFGTAEADCLDWGLSARVSLLPRSTPGSPAHLELSGGFAVLNANDARFVFLNEDRASPPSRIRRMGLALHASLASPWSPVGGANPIWLVTGVRHAFELGLALDSEHVSAGGAPPGFNVERFGLESTVLGLLSGRIGHVTDRLGDIVGNTWGFGVRLPLGPWASVSYDRASVPQPRDSGLSSVTRQGWSAWLDPVRMWTDHRAER